MSAIEFNGFYDLKIPKPVKEDYSVDELVSFMRELQNYCIDNRYNQKCAQILFSLLFENNKNQDDDKIKNVPAQGNNIWSYAQQIADVIRAFQRSDLYNRSLKTSAVYNKPLQQIYYGAPGTGKSYEINQLTKDESVIRTTFHPDSDYSTFVGAYKPVMTVEKTRVYPVVFNDGISLDKNNGTFDEKKISYQFVKQAFLKAYLGAWKKYSEGKNRIEDVKVKTRIVFNASGKYTIVSMSDDNIILSREFPHKKSDVQKEWNKLWGNGLFSIPSSQGKSGTSVQQAISSWINSNLRDCTENDFERGWDLLIEKIKEKGCVEVRRDSENGNNTQNYSVSVSDGTTDTVTIKCESKKWEKTIKNIYQQNKEGTKLENAIVEILKKYKGSFEEQWQQLKEVVSSGYEMKKIEMYTPQFLVIEEINRGNCAQIFGDLFQLLDRSKNGYSTYPIDADTDIQREIERAFREDGEYRVDSITLEEGVVDNYQSNYGNCTLADDILHGRVLLLPPNLYIWATMNTSDQSLFPIDSAFKRRWDWVYLPIVYKNRDWTIEIGDKKYCWVDFQRKINESIYSVDNSEDKQLGDYFVNADMTDGVISADTFLNKILFYLWNDVCKDDPDQIFRWEDNDQEKSIKFSDFFDSDKERKLQGFLAFLDVSDIAVQADGGDSEDMDDWDEDENEGITEEGVTM